MPKDFTRKHVRIDDIREIDETYWASNGEIMCRAVVEHAKLIQEANLSFPIILSADGRVMDGMERERGGRILLQVVKSGEANLGRHDSYGQRYILDFPLNRRGKETVIRSGWIIEHETETPRLTTCYPL